MIKGEGIIPHGTCGYIDIDIDIDIDREGCRSIASCNWGVGWHCVPNHVATAFIALVLFWDNLVQQVLRTFCENLPEL